MLSCVRQTKSCHSQGLPLGSILVVEAVLGHFEVVSRVSAQRHQAGNQASDQDHCHSFEAPRGLPHRHGVEVEVEDGLFGSFIGWDGSGQAAVPNPLPLSHVPWGKIKLRDGGATGSASCAGICEDQACFCPHGGKPGKSVRFATRSVLWNAWCRRLANGSKPVLGQIRRSTQGTLGD